MPLAALCLYGIINLLPRFLCVMSIWMTYIFQVLMNMYVLWTSHVNYVCILINVLLT